MEIRKAGLNDTQSISRIYALSWKKAYENIVPQSYLDDLKEDFWVDAFNNWISNNILTAQMIFDKGEAVGCIAYGKSRDETMPKSGEIVSIYLLPQYYGKGFGKVLLDTAINDMRNVGYQSIYLWVLEENLRAQKFYTKHGFSKTQDRLSCEISGKKLIDLRFIYKVE